MAIRDLIGNAVVGALTGGTSTSLLRDIPTAGVTERDYLTPSATRESSTASTAGATSFSNSIGSILKTGSATAKMATLVNQTTGDRQAVAVGSQDAQKLFGQGYVLETGEMSPEGQAAAAAASATAGATTSTSAETVLPTTTTATGYDLGSLRANAQRLRQEAFSTVYGYTPDDWQNLDPSAQRRLRNQRVQGIIGELGNVNAAIEMLKEEEKQARENALDNLNLLLKYDLIGQVSSDELNILAQQTGLSVSALQAIGEQEEPPELRSISGDLYSIQWNPETRTFDTQLILAGKTTGGGGDGTGGFAKEAAEMRDNLIAGKVSWGTAFDTLKVRYPEMSNDQINQALGGMIEYDEETGEFGKASGLAAGAGGDSLDALIAQTMSEI